jgi:hypothetical protein
MTATIRRRSCPGRGRSQTAQTGTVNGQTFQMSAPRCPMARSEENSSAASDFVGRFGVCEMPGAMVVRPSTAPLTYAGLLPVPGIEKAVGPSGGSRKTAVLQGDRGDRRCGRR